MADLHVLARPNTVHDMIIKELTELLERARAGDISGIAIAVIDREKNFDIIGKYESSLMMLGAITVLQASVTATVLT